MISTLRRDILARAAWGPGSPGPEGVGAGEAQLGLPDEQLGLARGLLLAPDPDSATRVVARFCAERFGAPVAAWAVRSHPFRLELVAVEASEAARSESLRSQMQQLPRYGDLSPAARKRLRERFCSLLGRPSVDVLDAGHALVMVAGEHAGPQRDLQELEELLRAALQQRTEVLTAQRRNASLELSLALTAHELRGPLLTSRAAIDMVAASPELAGDNQGTLNSVATLLAELAQSVDSILHWAAGTATLRTRRIDLSKVVGQAARETAGGDRSRLRLRMSKEVSVEADSRHLRLAIGNLIRNALEHAPAKTPVEVSVARRNGNAIVTVVDGGPGVSAPERASIFDPFVTGAILDGDRGGRGLGLFITRRVVEAHGGRVWVESNGRGARFRISLPVAEVSR
jgi:signal transduction histidine kinase